MRNSILHRLILVSLFVSVTLLNASEAGTRVSLLIEDTGMISGTVTDFENSDPLAGVNILIMNTTLGASTDQEGRYVIEKVPVGRIHLVVSYMGYTSRRRALLVKKDEELTADFHLQPGILETGAIVVTGTSTPYLYEEAPVKTEVIPRKLIEQTQSCNLAEALSLQTGVRVENDCQNCNFTQVRILGFDGKYSQVLIDGDPVVSTLAGVYALEQFPDEMISQIEIVKGGGSALYGGGAMAGTINLLTRQPNLDRTRISFDLQSLDGRLDRRAGVVSELVSDDGRAGAFIFGSSRQRDYYDRNNDAYSELGVLKHETLGVNTFYRTGGHTEIQASVHRINEDRRGGNDFDKPEHEADIAESTIHARWGGKLRWNHRISRQFRYQTYYSFSLLDRDSYYGGLGGATWADSLEALKYYGNTKNRTHILGVQSLYQAGNHVLTLGSEHYTDKLVDTSVKDERYHINNTIVNTGVYLQDDLALLNGKVNLISGVRLDRHSEIADPVISPRISIKVGLMPDLNLRSAFSTGFKAPQTFDEDLHIESLGGEQRVVRNVPDLRPEKIRTFSTGLEFEGFLSGYPLLIGVTGFYAVMNDAFTEIEDSGAREDLILWKRINSDGAGVAGIEADLGFKPTSRSEFRAGFTYSRSEYDSRQEIFESVFSKKFLRTPDFYGHFRVSFDATDDINVFGSGIYTGIMYVPNEASQQIIRTTQTFLELDLGLTWEVSFYENFNSRISLGIKNISDSYQKDLQSGRERDTAYVYGPQLPRRFYAGFDFSF